MMNRLPPFLASVCLHFVHSLLSFDLGSLGRVLTSSNSSAQYSQLLLRHLISGLIDFIFDFVYCFIAEFDWYYSYFSNLQIEDLVDLDQIFYQGGNRLEHWVWHFQPHFCLRCYFTLHFPLSSTHLNAYSSAKNFDR